LPLNSNESIYFEQAGRNVPFKTVDVVKYLGVYLDATSSSAKEVTYRLQQAGNAFRLLAPFLRHTSISVKWRLQVYRQVLVSILTYALSSATLEDALIKRLDSFHFKVLRTISGSKHTFFSKILSPTSEVVTMQDLHTRHMAISKSCLPPSQILSMQRMSFFGHILRHPDNILHNCCMRDLGDPRFLSTTLRKGAPRLHWTEMCYVEAYRKLTLLEHFPLPKILPLNHPFHSNINKLEVNNVLGGDTTYRPFITNVTRFVTEKAQNRDVWKKISQPR
jgi:hypothetical protein